MDDPYPRIRNPLAPPWKPWNPPYKRGPCLVHGGVIRIPGLPRGCQGVSCFTPMAHHTPNRPEPFHTLTKFNLSTLDRHPNPCDTIRVMKNNKRYTVDSIDRVAKTVTFTLSYGIGE